LLGLRATRTHSMASVIAIAEVLARKKPPA
jgi:hypothetical protein